MRIKNFPSVESIDGSQDALVIEQTEDSVDKSRKVSPAQIKQYVQTGDFTATGEITDGHGNILADMAKSADVNTVIGDLSQTGLTGDSVAEQLGDAKTYVDNAVSYKAGDVIANENIIAAAMGYNASDCYFTMPLSKPVVASSVSILNIKSTVYYGTNQKEVVSGATFTGTIQPNSILIKMTKANTFTEGARYIIDFKGTFTFS